MPFAPSAICAFMAPCIAWFALFRISSASCRKVAMNTRSFLYPSGRAIRKKQYCSLWITLPFPGGNFCQADATVTLATALSAGDASATVSSVSPAALAVIRPVSLTSA